ncbi:hypothetical protein HOY82DRAFT_540178 [Tuber indicum]|nr:hypothetical protein HOY82DRAFT_540178 [Tuber indicum]
MTLRHPVLSNIPLVLALLRRANQTVQPVYIRIAATMIGDRAIKIVFSIHNHNYSTVRCANKLTFSDSNNMRNQIREDNIQTIINFSTSNRVKFVGAGVTLGLDKICPRISPYIWKKLDIVGVLLKVQTRRWGRFGDMILLSMVPSRLVPQHENDNPAPRIGFRNMVMPDAQGTNKLVEGLKEYEDTVHKPTWIRVLKYGYELRGYNGGQIKGDPDRSPIKIAFSSATPQGGGVVLMRHSLDRLFSELGVDMSWFVPITSMVHNIHLLMRVTGIFQMPMRWLLESPRIIQGVANPGALPEVKIIYWSHIDICKDLVKCVGSPGEQVWWWIWGFVKEADTFIIHPVDNSVPNDVPFEIIWSIPACTAWLDGLNKPLGKWYLKFYNRNPRKLCNEQKICGHGAIDDPDAGLVLVRTTQLLQHPRYAPTRCGCGENWAK